MTTADKIILSGFSLASFAIVVFGGLYYPGTIAYKVACFVFSCN